MSASSSTRQQVAGMEYSHDGYIHVALAASEAVLKAAGPVPRFALTGSPLQTEFFQQLSSAHFSGQDKSWTVPATMSSVREIQSLFDPRLVIIDLPAQRALALFRWVGQDFVSQAGMCISADDAPLAHYFIGYKPGAHLSAALPSSLIANDKLFYEPKLSIEYKTRVTGHAISTATTEVSPTSYGQIPAYSLQQLHDFWAEQLTPEEQTKLNFQVVDGYSLPPTQMKQTSVAWLPHQQLIVHLQRLRSALESMRDAQWRHLGKGPFDYQTLAVLLHVFGERVAEYSEPGAGKSLIITNTLLLPILFPGLAKPSIPALGIAPLGVLTVLYEEMTYWSSPWPNVLRPVIWNGTQAKKDAIMTSFVDAAQVYMHDQVSPLLLPRTQPLKAPPKGKLKVPKTQKQWYQAAYCETLAPNVFLAHYNVLGSLSRQANATGRSKACMAHAAPRTLQAYKAALSFITTTRNGLTAGGMTYSGKELRAAKKQAKEVKAGAALTDEVSEALQQQASRAIHGQLGIAPGEQVDSDDNELQDVFEGADIASVLDAQQEPESDDPTKKALRAFGPGQFNDGMAEATSVFAPAQREAFGRQFQDADHYLASFETEVAEKLEQPFNTLGSANSVLHPGAQMSKTGLRAMHQEQRPSSATAFGPSVGQMAMGGYGPDSAEMRAATQESPAAADPPGYKDLFNLDIEAETLAARQAGIVAQKSCAFCARPLNGLQTHGLIRTVFFDEAHKLSTPTSITSQAAQFLSRPWPLSASEKAKNSAGIAKAVEDSHPADMISPTYVIPATGTPFRGNVTDIYGQSQVLASKALQFPSPYKYLQFYGQNVQEPYQDFPVWVEREDRAPVASWNIRDVSNRKLKAEIAPQLPPVLYRTIAVDLSAAERALYNGLKKDGLANIALRMGEAFVVAEDELARGDTSVSQLAMPEADVDGAVPDEIFNALTVSLLGEATNAQKLTAERQAAEIQDYGVLAPSTTQVAATRLLQIANGMLELLPDGSVRLAEPSSKLDALQELLEELGFFPRRATGLMKGAATNAFSAALAVPPSIGGNPLTGEGMAARAPIGVSEIPVTYDGNKPTVAYTRPNPAILCFASRQLLELFALRLQDPSNPFSRGAIPFVKITGGMSADERTSARMRFQREPSEFTPEEERDRSRCSVDLLLFSLSASPEGLTLTRADTIINVNRDFSHVNREQSINRISRYGAERHKVLNVIDLVAKGTIEAAQLQILKAKASSAATLLTDQQRLLNCIATGSFYTAEEIASGVPEQNAAEPMNGYATPRST